MQVESIRTRAWLDWLHRPLPFKSVTTFSVSDAKFLSKFYRGSIRVNDSDDWPVGGKIDKKVRENARIGLGISLSAKVGLVLFDSQIEYEFRALLSELINAYNYLLVYPLRDYDARNLYEIGVRTSGNVMVVSELLESAADEIIMLRFDESLTRGRSIPVRLIDPTGRWNSKELA